MDKLILVFYIPHEQINYDLYSDIQKNMGEDTKVLMIPTMKDDIRVECINPRFIKEDSEIAKQYKEIIADIQSSEWYKALDFGKTDN